MDALGNPTGMPLEAPQEAVQAFPEPSGTVLAETGGYAPDAFSAPVEDGTTPLAPGSFGPSTSVKVPTPKEAIEKSEKFSFALGQDPKQLLIAIARGDEEIVRQDEARKQETSNRMLRFIEAQRSISYGLKVDEAMSKALEPVDPSTVVEKAYGLRTMDFIKNSYVDPNIEIDTKSEEYIKANSDIIARNQFFLNLKKLNMEAREARSTFAAIPDFLGPAIVPYAFSSYRLRNQLGQPGSFTSPGENIKQQVDWAYTAPFNEATKRVKEVFDQLGESNLLSQGEFIDSLISFGHSDAAMANVGAFIDIVGAPGATKLAKTIRAGANASSVISPLSHVMAAVTGNSATANNLLVRAALTNGPDALKALEDQIPTMFDTKSLSNGKVVFSPETSSRILENIEAGKKVVANMLDNLIGASRLTGEEALKKGIEEATTLAVRQYDLPVDRIHAVRPLSSSETLGSEYIGIQMVASDGNMFSSAIRADEVARKELRLVKGSYNIVEHAPGEHLIEVLKPIDTRSLGVLDALKIDTDGLTPNVGLVGWVRSPEYMMNKSLQKENKSSVIAISKARSDFTQLIAPFKALKKDSIKALEGVFSFQASAKDKLGLVGRSSDTFEEFATDFYSVNKRAPTGPEAEAYFQAVFLENADLYIRNINIKRAKESLGLQTHVLSTKMDSGVKISTEYEGKFVTKLPWQENLTERDFFNLVIWDKSMTALGESAARPITKFSSAEAKANVEELLKNGYKIVQLSPDGTKKLASDWSTYFEGRKEGVTHILVPGDSLKSKPLSFKQVEYRSGFHKVLPDEGQIIAQPDIASTKFYDHYKGDVNVHHVMPGVDANDLVNRYNTMRDMKNTLDKMVDKTGAAYKKARADLDTYIKDNLPFNGGLKEVEGLVTKGQLNLGQRFYVKDVGTRLSAKNELRPVNSGKEWIDDLDNQFNLYRGNVDLSYTQARGGDMPSVAQIADTAGPVYKFTSTPQLSVPQVIDRSYRRLIKESNLADVQSRAVTEWVAEFNELIPQEYSRAQRDPMRVLQEFVYDKEKAKANPELFNRMQMQRRQVLEMLGMKSDFHKAIDNIYGSMVDSIMTKRGLGNFSVKDPHTWRELDSPVQFFRNVGFHLSMSLYNPVQAVVNLMTLTHINSLTPLHGIPGTFGAFMSLALRFNDKPQMLKHADKIMGKFGWKGGDFEAAHKAMSQVGWNHVGGEISSLADVMSPLTMKSTLGDVLDGSSIFFRRTEQMLREASWYAAWSEHRKLNPTKVFGKDDYRTILNRADILTVNMTSASNATWQKGLTSLPTQFASYQTRLGEQLLSFGEKQVLTGREKIQLMAGYSAAFGIPAGGVGAMFGITGPWHELIDKQLKERGVATDTNVVTQVLHKGIAGATMSAITGQPWDTTRFAPSGNQMLKDLIFPEDSGDRFKALSGVGLAAAWNVVKSLDGPLKGFIGTIPGVRKSEDLGFVEQDVIDVLNSFGTGKFATKAFFAMKMGTFVDKRGGILMETNATEGLLAALTGTMPQKISDFYTMMKSEKDYKTYINDVTTQYGKYIGLAFKENDPVQQKKYFARAKVLLEGMSPQDVSLIVSRAWKTQDNQIDNMTLRFTGRSADRVVPDNKGNQ